MAIRVALQHTTSYRYGKPIGIGPQVIRLRPGVHTRTPVHSYSLDISPGDHFLNWQQDPQGNILARVVVPEKHDHLTISVELVVDMVVFNPSTFLSKNRQKIGPSPTTTVYRKSLSPTSPAPTMRESL